jgi:predicted nucleic acid-binding protein
MQRGEVVELDTAIALNAARLGSQHKLPLADSIILATAWSFGATLWTQDVDFDGLPGVRYKAK